MFHTETGYTGFQDRQHGGRVLADQLSQREWVRPVVLGLARGGVPVAAEVASALNAPLRVSVARKIGAPGQPELALGAVTAQGPATYDESLLRAFHLNPETVERDCARERDEARRREELYQRGAPLDLAGRDVVLVDDGLATGATARAAVRMVRQAEPRTITLAVPVGASDAVGALRDEADVVECVLEPRVFNAVGQWYRRFEPTSDDTIMRVLDEVRTS